MGNHELYILHSYLKLTRRDRIQGMNRRISQTMNGASGISRQFPRSLEMLVLHWDPHETHGPLRRLTGPCGWLDFCQLVEFTVRVSLGTLPVAVRGIKVCDSFSTQEPNTKHQQNGPRTSVHEFPLNRPPVSDVASICPS